MSPWIPFRRGVGMLAFVSVALALATSHSHGNTFRIATDTSQVCAGCHTQYTAVSSILLTTPGNGGTLTFGNNGNTLVKQTSTAMFTIKNNFSNHPTLAGATNRGGGFSGSFPSVVAGTEFGGPTTSARIVGTIRTGFANGDGYLIPQASESRNYTYTPQQRSLGVFDTTQISFTPLNGFTSPAPTATITLRGKGVAPQISLNASGVNAGNVLVGASKVVSFSVQNVGDGNLSGLADSSSLPGGSTNLKGSFAAGSVLFEGTGGAFTLADNTPALVKSYTFRPTIRGAAGTASLAVDVTANNGSSDGLNNAQVLPVQLTGQGVAPQISVTNTKLNAGAVLVGDMVGGTAKLTVSNVGDGHLAGTGASFNLNGSFVSVAGEFTGGAGFSIASTSTLPAPSQEQVYTFKPGSRGDKSQVVSISATNGSDNGQNQSQTLTGTLIGKGVAPQVSLDTSQANPRNVRIGTSSNYILTVNNVGDGNESGLGDASNLKGNFAAGTAVFSTTGPVGFSIPDNGSQMKDYTFTPTSRGEATLNADVTTDNGNSDGSNGTQTLPIQLTGTGVGPKFASSIAANSIIDFGGVSAPSTLPLTLFNDTPDPELGPLTLLTLLSFNISGADANLFSLQSFSAGTQLGKGASLALGIGFSGVGAPGPHSAMLSFVTDEGAALGVDGNVFDYSLQGTVIAAVPEATPAQMLGAGLVCMGLLIMRKRRKAGRGALAHQSQPA